jgi:tRNA(Ile)-lysidine synthase
MGAEAIAAAFRERLAQSIPAGSAICAGFSGGLDSTVLVHLLSEVAVPAGYAVRAVHVHHGLSPNADRWLKFCERFCARSGIPLDEEHVQVDRQSALGLEAAARLARYAVFTARREPFVALAHHLDDQAETVLLQLIRGAGIKGIAAMPDLRALPGSGVQIFRPLLEHSRSELAQYAADQGLQWVEDESNESTVHERNFLRRDVAPLLDARHPAWRESLARFARHAAGASRLLDDLATLDGVPLAAGEPLPLDERLTPERRANALRAFLARNVIAMPSEARLAEISRQLFEAREDAQVRIEHAGVAIVRQKAAAFIDRRVDAPGSGAPRSAWRVPWLREREIDLGHPRGTLTFEPVKGEGIDASHAQSGEWYVAYRAGGETMRLADNRPTRTLKNLLQERAIPAWDRETLPLLFRGDTLVWVPGVGVAVEFACPPGREGLLPTWRVAGKAPVC